MHATDLILVRHGETDWNREKRLQGHTDIPLNAEGRRQATLLGAALAGERLHAVIASDLQRARQTAEALAAPHGLTVLTDARLRERTYGVIEGLCHHEIAERHPLNYRAWQTRDPDFEPERGESLRAFASRVSQVVIELASRHAGQTVALVAHGGVLDCVYRMATGQALEAPRTQALLNAAVNRLRWEHGALRLMQWGEVGHLSGATLDEVDRQRP